MFELTIPLSPSVNSYKRVGRTVTTKTGRKLQYRVNTDETKQFYCDVINLVRAKGLKFAFLDEISLEVHLDIYPTSNRSDIDNFIKPCLDSLQHAKVFHNDRQISRLVVEKKAIMSPGQIIVRIKPYVNVP